MKIAIPTAEGKLCNHFGHCEYFSIFEVDKENSAIKDQHKVEPPPHQPGMLPGWVSEQGAKIVIAGGMGQRAKQLFAEQGIQVLVGAPVEEPHKLVHAYLKGALISGSNACDH